MISIAAISGGLSCVAPELSTFAGYITEIREQHSQSLHPELVTARDRRGHLVISGRIGSDPGAAQARDGTVIVEVRDESGRLLREVRECYHSRQPLNERRLMLSYLPPEFIVDLGPGFDEPISLVIRAEPGRCPD
ncbi:MAG: hypothetical protein ABS79_01500 [Planctomycetes bacterium SCN 63-9]|nr:MAG: hypothetical protein ABS79_01500 [Planctomycetes bacterium SCN 63-9]